MRFNLDMEIVLIIIVDVIVNNFVGNVLKKIKFVFISIKIVLLYKDIISIIIGNFIIRKILLKK